MAEGLEAGGRSFRVTKAELREFVLAAGTLASSSPGQIWEG